MTSTDRRRPALVPLRACVPLRVTVALRACVALIACVALRACVALIACVTLLSLSRTARADDHHYQNYLIGERAVGFAGAFTAIADDSSAVFYNPAGLTQLTYSSVNLSAAIYGFASERVELSSATLVGGGADNANTTFVTYPTTAAWIQQLRKGGPDGAGRMMAAFSLITPASAVRRSRSNYETVPVAAGGGQLSERGLDTQLAEDDTLWVGLSFAWRPLARLHVGATVSFTMRTGIYQFFDIGAQTLTVGGLARVEGRSSRIAATLKQYGLLATVGALYELTDHLRLGATFRTPQLALKSSAGINLMAAERPDLNTPPDVQTIGVDGEFHDKQPFRAALGLAYVRPRRFAVSVDFALYGPTGLYNVVELDNGFQFFPLERRLVWQVDVGAEYYLFDWLPLRAGFFTNLSAYKGPDSCAGTDTACQDRLDNPFADPIDRFGFAGSIGYELTRATITLAFSYNFGKTTRELAPGLEATGSRSLLFLVLGSSFRF